MSKENNGGEAFPFLRETGNPETPLYMGGAGMSMRDYFAAKALSGFARGTYAYVTDDCSLAYRYADAMLAEREKQ